MKRKDEGLRARLLVLAQEIADREGVGAINIRTLAERAGIATGTVYNYFSSKDEILFVLTEEFWRDTLHQLDREIKAHRFVDQLESVFQELKNRLETASGTMSRLRSLETIGQRRMAAMQDELEAILVRRLREDETIRADVWSPDFTMEAYARFMMRNMVVLLRSREADFGFLREMVLRTLY
ncbi:MAG: TetR family transcriptional regulator [Bacillota bacterium]|nr:TetR family transcriptional regulator [Bacillota bacterium]